MGRPFRRRVGVASLSSLFEWTPERIEKDYNVDGVARDITWLEAWQRCSTEHDKRRCIIEWDGLLIAGWKPLPDAA